MPPNYSLLIRSYRVRIFYERSVNFEIYFWCHRFDQNSNKNIVRVSALKFFVVSWALPGSIFGLSGDFNNVTDKEAYKEA